MKLNDTHLKQALMTAFPDLTFQRSEIRRENLRMILSGTGGYLPASGKGVPIYTPFDSYRELNRFLAEECHVNFFRIDLDEKRNRILYGFVTDNQQDFSVKLFLRPWKKDGYEEFE